MPSHLIVQKAHLLLRFGPMTFAILPISDVKKQVTRLTIIVIIFFINVSSQFTKELFGKQKFFGIRKKHDGSVSWERKFVADFQCFFFAKM
jgi:hypothetical protein